MPSAGPRHKLLLALGVATLLVTAGCGAMAGSPTTAPDSTTPDNGTVSREFPEAPATLTAETAAETAAEYHTSLLVRSIEPDEPGEYGTIPRASGLDTAVVSNGGEGYYVTVGLPEGVGEGIKTTAPHLDRAMYHVTPNATPDAAYPVRHTDPETFQGEGPAVTPVDVVVSNFDSKTTSLTLVITSLEGDYRTVLVREVEVGPGTVLELDAVIGTAGQYRVTAIGPETTRSRVLTVDGETATAPIGVYVESDGGTTLIRGPG